MEHITSAAELKRVIQRVEIEHAMQGKRLKEQFFLAYENLKPANILKSTLNEITKSPYLIDNVLGATLGLITGYLSKKIAVAGSGNPIRKLIGSVLQFGITNLVAQHPDLIKLFGQFIMQHLFRKKEMNSVKPC
jgi:hypothetical protein